MECSNGNIFEHHFRQTETMKLWDHIYEHHVVKYLIENLSENLNTNKYINLGEASHNDRLALSH